MLKAWYDDLKFNWPRFVNNVRQIVCMLASLIGIGIVLWLLAFDSSMFDDYQRVILQDQFLNWFPVRDFSFWILMLWSSLLIITFVTLIAYPHFLSAFIQFVSLFLVIRFFSLYATYFKYPEGFLTLSMASFLPFEISDKSVSHFVYLSGFAHISMICTFVVPRDLVRWILIVLSSLLYILLSFHHFYYFIDVLSSFILIKVIYKLYFYNLVINPSISNQYSYTKSEFYKSKF